MRSLSFSAQTAYRLGQHLAAGWSTARRHRLKKVVLAYSGGLDTSVAVAWLGEKYGADVVTLTVDVGGGSLREGVARRAISAGASRAYVVDARRHFVEDFVWPSLQANAVYQDAYPLATALARPLIAQLLVEIAQREGADAVAHGCTGKGNDQVRFDVAVKALDPRLEVVAPLRVGMGMSREQEIEYAHAQGIEIPVTKASPYSIDVNLWGRSIETGVLEDPWVTPPDDVYEWTVDPANAPPAVDITIGFEHGVPVALDGKAVDPVVLVERLNELAGGHGVGRIDHVEDRLVGIKSREIYEAPAAVTLHAAHRALEALTLTKEQLRFNRLVSEQLAQSTYDGLWFSALQRDLREYVRRAQTPVSGEVRIRLDHGSAMIVGRRSDQSLYDQALATYDAGDAFDHAAAVGFISIWGLPLRTEAARHGSAWGWTEPLLPQVEVAVTEPEAVETNR
jgi:argininosuccinate synthase